MGERKLTEQEKQNLKDNIALHERQLKLIEKEYELKKKLFEIADEKPEVIEPKYKYEGCPRYWAVYKELSKVLHEQELVGIEAQLQQLRNTIREKKIFLEKEGGE